jgi:hypothetical protein
VSPWSLVTLIDAWLHVHARLVAAICMACFALSCAQYAGFIRLPELWHLPATLAWVVPALRYGVWEVMVTPKLQARRQRLEGLKHE